MLSRLNTVFKKSSRNLQLPLGRWGTIKTDEKNEKKVQERIEKNAISGNHDHCGSEICKTPTKNDDYKDELKKFMKDPYWFYVI
tara:strand:+ start:326 stop:577 length:252 start_codon:yes stop_codon:yes gene_type:complete